jgi:hypothetical protein
MDDKLYKIILFQCERKLKNLASSSLTLLEARHQYIQDLEKVLTKMGIEGYDIPKVEFQRDRKAILDLMNLYVRELQEVQKMV